MVNERNNKIDIIKGYAIALVVFGHAIALLLQKEIFTGIFWTIIYDVIYTFHMPLFFCISGYLYSMNDCKKLNTILWKNVISLYFPYLILNYVYWFERIIATELLGVQLTRNVPSFSLKEGIRLLYSGDGLTWFLLSLFIVKSLFDIVVRFTSYSVCGVLFTILFWCGVLFPTCKIWEYLAWGIFFFVGNFIKKKELEIETIEIKNILCLFSINFIGIGIVRFVESGLDMLVKLMIGLSIFCILILKQGYIRDLKILKLCGEYSMVIYMVHGFSQYITYFFLTNIVGIENGVWILYLMTILQVALALFVVVCFTKIKWLKWLEIFFYPYKYLKKLVS